MTGSSCSFALGYHICERALTAVSGRIAATRLTPSSTRATRCQLGAGRAGWHCRRRRCRRAAGSGGAARLDAVPAQERGDLQRDRLHLVPLAIAQQQHVPDVKPAGELDNKGWAKQHDVPDVPDVCRRARAYSCCRRTRVPTMRGLSEAAAAAHASSLAQALQGCGHCPCLPHAGRHGAGGRAHGCTMKRKMTDSYRLRMLLPNTNTKPTRHDDIANHTCETSTCAARVARRCCAPGPPAGDAPERCQLALPRRGQGDECCVPQKDSWTLAWKRARTACLQ